MSEYRLDYIGNFKPGAAQSMIEIRHRYIDLEKNIVELRNSMKLRLLASEKSDRDENYNRVFDEALKHLECSQMYAIKMCCLLGEERCV